MSNVNPELTADIERVVGAVMDGLKVASIECDGWSVEAYKLVTNIRVDIKFKTHKPLSPMQLIKKGA